MNPLADDAAMCDQYAAIWDALNASGHGDCGGYTFTSGDSGVLCACDAVIALPLGAEKLERA